MLGTDSTLPSLTPAQLVANLSAIVALAVDAALIADRTSKLLIGVAAIVIPLGWQIADAVIRHGRSRIAAAAVAKGYTHDQVRALMRGKTDRGGKIGT